MSWGYKITIFYVSFVVMILAYVFAAVNQDWHLVTEDYYGEEIRYSDRIQRTTNAAQLSSPVQIKRDGNGEIVLNFPSEIAAPVGKVNLYRPSDARRDQQHALHLDANNRQVIDASNLKGGKWRVQVSWEDQGTPYYAEQIIVLP
ncbi:MAG: FixH family protein [Bacteroidota bacterium]